MQHILTLMKWKPGALDTKGGVEGGGSTHGNILFSESHSPRRTEGTGVCISPEGRLSRMGQNQETFPCIFADDLPG
jgi:hypothetical protein